MFVHKFFGGGRGGDGLSDLKYQVSLASARMEPEQLAIMAGQGQKQGGSMLAEQANWASSQSGAIGTAWGSLTSYIIK